ncbi:MAG: hypothetical protein PHO08_08360 [Methylococcales bacterium]|nr:hypothetical protein [Methylococcales bacterium]
MTDFLTGLLNRTQNTQIALQRRRPSLFEPNIGFLAVRGHAAELLTGEADQEQITANDRRNNGSNTPAVGIPSQSALYTAPRQSGESALLPPDASIRLTEQHAEAAQSAFNKPGLASGDVIYHTEHVQTIREIQIEKPVRPAEPNAPAPQSSGATERLIERSSELIVPLPLQRIETLREIQIEKPIVRALTGIDNTPIVPAKTVTPAEPAEKAPSTTAPQSNHERVVQADVRVTPVQAPKADALTPKPKEQIVRDIADTPVAGEGRNKKRESADFAEAQRATEPTPTIQVTIGRIEVRATQQPANSPSTRSSTPRLSLEDYLRQRNGGGR